MIALSEIDGKATVILGCTVGMNGIAVETPAKSSIAARNLLDLVGVAVEIPVNWLNRRK
ncbi:hypothetical protein GQF01_19100 [Paenibacillus sp. 5J-6]|uniref:Uncharacterized protein n=1 Tax=Paenibacillus silvestris TaxID=2606219 RepID=A0A6L8V3U3_9BACL|nr:hypothetical protein [Paenibacillus silvestris]MZQ84226.1 hypothetical protein [Paenibacillus silvestris]